MYNILIYGFVFQIDFVFIITAAAIEKSNFALGNLFQIVYFWWRRFSILFAGE